MTRLRREDCFHLNSRAPDQGHYPETDKRQADHTVVELCRARPWVTEPEGSKQSNESDTTARRPLCSSGAERLAAGAGSPLETPGAFPDDCRVQLVADHLPSVSLFVPLSRCLSAA